MALLCIILCFQSIVVYADTPAEAAQKIKNEIEASQNAEPVSFSPIYTEIVNSDWRSSGKNWFLSGELRAMISSLLVVDIASNDGNTDLFAGLYQYPSYVGKLDMESDVYIIVGMYEDHTFEIYYSPKENSGAYRITPTIMTENAIQTLQQNNLSSSCTQYFENKEQDIQSSYQELGEIFDW